MYMFHHVSRPLAGSKFKKSWGDAKDKLVDGLLFYLKAQWSWMMPVM